MRNVIAACKTHQAKLVNVEHTLVRTNLILVTRVFIDVWRDQDGVTLAVGRQRRGERARHRRR